MGRPGSVLARLADTIRWDEPWDFEDDDDDLVTPGVSAEPRASSPPASSPERT